MKRRHRAGTTVLLVAILGALSVAQSAGSGYDQSAHRGSVKPRDSFLDFTLKRINPSATDYGQCLSESRTMLLEETIRNAYFWSNIVSLGLLSCLFFIVLYQHRIRARREWSTAEIIEQLEHSLSRARAQVAEATKKNHDLADALARLKECATRAPSSPLVSTDIAVGAATKPRTPNPQPAPPTLAKANSGKPENGSAAHGPAVKESAGQMRLFTPDADFVMKLNSLEQQLAQSREDNKQLRRRIADGDRKLAAKENKTRQLEGA